jgi:hypothetical protein
MSQNSGGYPQQQPEPYGGGYGNQGPDAQRYGQSSSPFPQDLPPREKKGGFLGKILGKAKASSGGGGYPGHGGYGQTSGGFIPSSGYGSHGPPGGGGGGFMGHPPQGGFIPSGGYGYGGHGAPGGGYGGYPQRRTGGGSGMGMAAGGAALGVGAGLLGGAMIANAFDDDNNESYQDGFGTSRPSITKFVQACMIANYAHRGWCRFWRRLRRLSGRPRILALGQELKD